MPVITQDHIMSAPFGGATTTPTSEPSCHACGGPITIGRTGDGLSQQLQPMNVTTATERPPVYWMVKLLALISAQHPYMGEAAIL